jgi:hypothetical protein
MLFVICVCPIVKYSFSANLYPTLISISDNVLAAPQAEGDADKTQGIKFSHHDHRTENPGLPVHDAMRDQIRYMKYLDPFRKGPRRPPSSGLPPDRAWLPMVQTHGWYQT